VLIHLATFAIVMKIFLRPLVGSSTRCQINVFRKGTLVPSSFLYTVVQSSEVRTESLLC
jgi:hypothetical protein